MFFVFCDLRRLYSFEWARWSPDASASILSPVGLREVPRAAGGRSARLTCRCLVTDVLVPCRCVAGSSLRKVLKRYSLRDDP